MSEGHSAATPHQSQHGPAAAIPSANEIEAWESFTPTEPLDDLPDLTCIREAIAQANKPRSSHYSRNEAADLQALGIDHTECSDEADSALNQLEWFSERRCFEWAFRKAQEELEMLYEKDPGRWADIFNPEGFEPRGSHGFLSARFIQWYGEFCTFDAGTGYRQLSFEMWARGDFFGEEDPNAKPQVRGHKGKEKHSHTVEWLIAHARDRLSHHPRVSAAQIWQHIRRHIDVFSTECEDLFNHRLDWEDTCTRSDNEYGVLVFDGDTEKRMKFSTFRKKIQSETRNK